MTKKNITSETAAQCAIQNFTNILPCPICGGEVIEGNLSWNMAHAECTKCSATWGHCGSKFEGRFDKWNQRAR